MKIFGLVDRRNSRGRKGRTAGRLFHSATARYFPTAPSACLVELDCSRFRLRRLHQKFGGRNQFCCFLQNRAFLILWPPLKAGTPIFFFSSAVFLAYETIPEEMYLSG
ncbi:MAG: hypothetical protein DMF38_10655 [Verrucomicrobia bacterium]|nr:MAG: hypothetical protein DME78_01220 [Verrucomicrobiota bacterium]PYL33685.1 MAG: hypothetical protein DMF38_10655 [Verrucomicrobiota bacterium]